jgi:NADPH:quinone reductase-like Zn-dependent oxidoreductase
MAYAILERTFGGPEVLTYAEKEIPRPRQDEVLIRVRAAGVNPVDIGVRQGYMRFPLPLVPGCDVAGVVDAVGSRVTEYAAGDEVYAMIGFSGGYTEYAVAPVTYLAPKPYSLDFVHAAAVPLASLAAWQSLFDLGNLKAGQRILIHGAAGGVGSFAVQFACVAGAYVIGTAAAQDADYLRGIGANEVIDYKTVRFEDAVHDVDFVFDLIGGETQDRSWQVLRQGGTLVTTKNEPSAARAREKNAVAKRLLVHPNGMQLREIGALIDAGRVQVTVTDTFSLARAGDAHVLLQTSHTRGKIVLTI